MGVRVEPEFDAARLGDPEIERAFTQHAYLARVSKIRFAREGEAIDVDAPLALQEVEPYAVVGEAKDAVRVVEAYDGARLALWVERTALAPTIKSSTELLDSTGAAGDGTHGVWLAAGTQIDISASEHHSALRTLAVKATNLEAVGKVHEDKLAEVFTGPVPDPKVGDGKEYVTATTIYAAPGTTSRVLATVTSGQTARQLDSNAGWAEIELERAGLRVRGFVKADAIGRPGMQSETFGALGHGSFGISDTDKLVVPAGTCLYDHDEGTVIGVELETQERFGYRRVDKSWSYVYVGTQHWAHPMLTIKSVGEKIWESCAAK